MVEPPPKDLLDKLKKLIGPQGDTILDRPISGKLVKCHIGWGDDEAQQLYLKFSGEMDFNEDGERRRYELGMRAAENASRLATIVAVGRGVRAVFKEDIGWGIALARESFKAADGGAERYMHEYFEFPKQCNRVAEAFRKAKFLPEPKVYREFGRNQRWGNELPRVLNQLKLERRIRDDWQTPPNGGHKMFGWKWIGDEDF